MSSPCLHHQFRLHQSHGSSCRQTDRPTDMSITAPTHVHLFNSLSGQPLQIIQHTTLKTFDKDLIIQDHNSTEICKNHILDRHAVQYKGNFNRVKFKNFVMWKFFIQKLEPHWNPESFHYRGVVLTEVSLHLTVK